MDASAGGERGPVRLSSTASHCATPRGAGRPRGGAHGHDEAAPGAWCCARRVRPVAGGAGAPAPTRCRGLSLPRRLPGYGTAFRSRRRRWAPAPARTGRRVRCGRSRRPPSRAPPPDEPCRAAGPRKLRAVSPAVAAVWALRARWSRSVVWRYRRFASGVSVTSEKPLLGCGSSGWSRPSSSAMARNLRLWYRPARDVSRTPRAAAMPWTASCSSRSKESSCPHADDDSPIRDSGAARSGSSGWYR